MTYWAAQRCRSSRSSPLVALAADPGPPRAALAGASGWPRSPLLVLTASSTTCWSASASSATTPPASAASFVGVAPLEDFAYAIAAVVLLPSPVGAADARRRRRVGGEPMIRALLLTSRPLSWVNTAFPFAAAYLVATGRIDAHPRSSARSSSSSPTTSRCTASTTSSTTSPTCATRARAASRARCCSRAGTARPSSHPGLLAAAVRRLPGRRRQPGQLARARDQPVRGRRLLGRRGCASRSARSSTRSPRARTSCRPAVYGLALVGADVHPGAGRRCSAPFFLWGAASHAFGAVQDVVADREAGIGSIATVIGARATVRLVDRALPARRASCCSSRAGPGRSPRCSCCRTRSTRCRGGTWTTQTPPPRTAAGGASCGSTSSPASW